MTVYFTDEQISGRAFAERVLRESCGIRAPRFLRGEHGKPYLADGPLFFSLTHSRRVTVAAEWRARPLPQAYLRRLSPAEREEDFFRLWTAKEAYVKFCGGTLADMLPSLRFEKGLLLLNGVPVSAEITFAEADGFCLALCAASPQTIELRHA